MSNLDDGRTSVKQRTFTKYQCISCGAIIMRRLQHLQYEHDSTFELWRNEIAGTGHEKEESFLSIIFNPTNNKPDNHRKRYE